MFKVNLYGPEHEGFEFDTRREAFAFLGEADNYATATIHDDIGEELAQINISKPWADDEVAEASPEPVDPQSEVVEKPSEQGSTAGEGDPVSDHDAA